MKAVKIEIVGCILLATLWGGILGYNHLRDVFFREGYERGMKHFAAYHNCFSPPITPWNEMPSVEWRNEAWKFVNDDPNDCAFVISADNYAHKRTSRVH